MKYFFDFIYYFHHLTDDEIMTRPQKIKSLLNFICFIVSALIYAKTINNEYNTEKSKQTEQSKMAEKSKDPSDRISTHNYLNN
jgi:hypothetical protein